MIHTNNTTISSPPVKKLGVMRWVRNNLFRNTFDSIVTISVVLFLLWIVPAVFSWMFFDAVGFNGDEALCRATDGACWPFMREKARLILFGTYPYEQQWRAALACLVVIGLVATLIFKRMKVKWMVLLWATAAAVFVALMLGNVFGLPAVQTVKWNGLPVFLLLSVFSLAAAFPLGILLALARHQDDYLFLKTWRLVILN